MADDEKKKPKTRNDRFVSKEADMTFVSKDDDDEWIDIVIVSEEKAAFKAALAAMSPFTKEKRARLINAGVSGKLGCVASFSIVDDDDKTFNEMKKVLPKEASLKYVQ